MAKFFVGQRVRILRSFSWPELAGSEGCVVGLGDVITAGPWAGVQGITVAPDCWGTSRAPHTSSLSGATHFCPLPDQLEPILPSGHHAATESFQELMDRLNTEKVERVEEVGA